MSELQVPIRIKRGVGGAPATLLRGELAYNETSNELYVGKGASGSNDASGRPIAATVQQLLAPAQVLSALSDVAITSGLSNGDVLTYDATAGEWIAQAVAAASVAWSDVTGKPSTFAPSAHASSHHTGGADAITAANIGAAAASHTHSDATTSVAGFMSSADKAKLDGVASGATANTGTVTSVVGGTGLTGGTITSTGTLAVSYGTTAGTACEGNDARLSDSRTPTSHTHSASDITSGLATVAGTGSYNDLTNRPSTFTPSAHAHTIQQELSGFIESPQAKTYVLSPATHAALTITQLKAQTSAGTVDVKLQDDGADVAGATLADAGTALASLASEISVAVAAGSKLTLVVSDPQSSPADLAFTVHYTIASGNNS